MSHPLVLDLLKRCCPYLFRAGSLLNVGANRVRFELGSELHQVGRRITLLEVWPENAAHYDGDKRLEAIAVGDVRELDRLGLGSFDACLWWHGPEHVAKEDLPGAVAQLETAAEGLVVLGCPYGRYPQGEFMGNPYETHRASLYPEDFTALGYRVATIGEKDHPDGSIIAWKHLRKSGDQIPHVVMLTSADRVGYLRETAPAVLRTAWPLTLTVVANAPGAESRAYLEEMEPDLFELIVYKRNQGIGRAHNRAWGARDAAYTMMLDDDALPLEPDWLRKLVDIIDCCPEVGIVGHSVEPVDWPLQVLGNPARTVQVQPGNLGLVCMMVPRRTEAICGRFNEELPLYGEFDGLYGWKVRRAGLLCAYFDHSVHGRSFRHLGGGKEEPGYRAWKDGMRAKAQPVRDRLIAEYEAGRPLNK